MSGDYYKEWRAKAEVDCFPQLVILWLSTNSWYRSHYSEIVTKRVLSGALQAGAGKQAASQRVKVWVGRFSVRWTPVSSC